MPTQASVSTEFINDIGTPETDTGGSPILRCDPLRPLDRLHDDIAGMISSSLDYETPIDIHRALSRGTWHIFTYTTGSSDITQSDEVYFRCNVQGCALTVTLASRTSDAARRSIAKGLSDTCVGTKWVWIRPDRSEQQAHGGAQTPEIEASPATSRSDAALPLDAIAPLALPHPASPTSQPDIATSYADGGSEGTDEGVVVRAHIEPSHMAFDTAFVSGTSSSNGRKASISHSVRGKAQLTADEVEQRTIKQMAEVLLGPVDRPGDIAWAAYDEAGEVDVFFQRVPAEFASLVNLEFTSDLCCLKPPNHFPIRHLDESGRPFFVVAPLEELGGKAAPFDWDMLLETVGPDAPVDAFCKARQGFLRMTLGDLRNEMSKPHTRRVSILNALNFQLPETMSYAYSAPTLIKELEMREHTGSARRQQYDVHLSISMASSWSASHNFHIDYGGTGVWVHQVVGEKVWFVVNPHEDDNLAQYEQWHEAGSKGWLGDIISNVHTFICRPGITFFLPPGFIHGVYTLTDSAVLGQVYLSSYNLATSSAAWHREVKAGDKSTRISDFCRQFFSYLDRNYPSGDAGDETLSSIHPLVVCGIAKLNEASWVALRAAATNAEQRTRGLIFWDMIGRYYRKYGETKIYERWAVEKLKSLGHTREVPPRETKRLKTARYTR